MPKRRSHSRSLATRAALGVGALARRLCARAVHRPVDSLALLVAIATSLVIIVNAAFLQSGSLPSPFFANPLPPPAAPIAAETHPKITTAVPPAPAAPAPQPVVARRNDPIAELIGPSSRILAVQRVLSDYGYGQIKPTGMLDSATSAAIERFERERKLPITGRVSDRLVNELATMIGHPLQ